MASIVVTHDLHSAKTIADRIALLHEGNVLIEGTFPELEKSDDKFVACESALALGRLGETKAVPDLISLLDEPNGNLRFAGAEALGQICDPIARAALLFPKSNCAVIVCPGDDFRTLHPDNMLDGP